MTQRARILLPTVVVITALVVAALFASDAWSGDDEAATVALRDTGTAEVMSLVEHHEVEGTVAFDDPTTAYAIGAGGIITTLVPEGTLVGPGEILWRIGNEPTVALSGTIPSYRDLGDDDEGDDVRQLEENLVALGFDPNGTVTIDDTFTGNTEAMVERWQEAIGAAVTGSVAPSAVVVIDGSRRVGDVAVVVGQETVDGLAMLTLAAETRELTASLDPADREALAVGDKVTAQLPDRTEFTATVMTVVGTPGGGADITAAIAESVDTAADQIPVNVSWTIDVATDVVTVSATSILRTDDGRYHVEVRDPAGMERLVEVEVGATSDGRVEIRGEIDAGDVVIDP